MVWSLTLIAKQCLLSKTCIGNVGVHFWPAWWENFPPDANSCFLTPIDEDILECIKRWAMNPVRGPKCKPYEGCIKSMNLCPLGYGYLRFDFPVTYDIINTFEHSLKQLLKPSSNTNLVENARKLETQRSRTNYRHNF